MNGYLKIAIIACIILFISISNEKYNVEYLKSDANLCNYIYIYLIRWIHYFVFLYMSFYVLYFNGIGNSFDVYLFLFLSLFIVFGWYLTECCWLSFIELLYYNVNLKDIETTYHPSVYSISFGYCDIFMTLSGIFLILNVSIVLYYLKEINISYKIIYYITFLLLFADGIIKGRMNKKCYNSEKNATLAFINKNYTKFFCPL